MRARLRTAGWSSGSGAVPRETLGGGSSGPFHVKRRLFEDAKRIGLDLTSDQGHKLGAYERLLMDVALPKGMLGPGEGPVLYERHILDSLRAAAVFTDRDRLAYDLGSGAGLPGIVLAVAVVRCRFLLIETRKRRAAFLERVVEELALGNVDVFPGRVEDVTEAADVITARAFAPMDRAWAVARPILREGGRLVYFAGANVKKLEGAEMIQVLERFSPIAIMTRT